MRVRSNVLQYFHLDDTYSLLTGRNVKTLLDYFKLLDIHGTGMNDLQFLIFMQTITDLTKIQIYKVFDMLDVDGSGQLDFDEFYLLMCLMVAVKDAEDKNFIYRHSRTVFDLIDEDGSNSISAEEFENFGFLFDFSGGTVDAIFNEFDISGDASLDYKEFRMFAMACIDKQNEIQKQVREKWEEKQRKAEMKAAKRQRRAALHQDKNPTRALLVQELNPNAADTLVVPSTTSTKEGGGPSHSSFTANMGGQESETHGPEEEAQEKQCTLM